MKRLAERRTILLAAGTVAVAAVAASAQPSDLRGTVDFEGGAVIPEGKIEIYLQNPGVQDDARQPAAEARVNSDGKSKTIGFALSSPAIPASGQGAEIIARLERADGWLLARGSAQIGTGSPVNITLYTAMY